jgi:hypothetical protein
LTQQKKKSLSREKSKNKMALDKKDYTDFLKDVEISAKSPDLDADVSFLLSRSSEIIKKLVDENDSLWDMLEEIKSSDMKNYSKEFQQMLDRKLLEVKLMTIKKPVRA